MIPGWPLPVSFLDVFAERPLAGNGLAVVGEADALSEETMRAFAKETRLLETTFVQSTSAEGADYRNRIWDPHESFPSRGTRRWGPPSRSRGGEG